MLTEPVQAPKPTLSLPEKPSIAILPFANMSGDPEQEYFADGITDDIITGLSRFPDLFVIARNSSFQYKGKAIDVRQVGRELGVRYVLEGVFAGVATVCASTYSSSMPLQEDIAGLSAMTDRSTTFSPSRTKLCARSLRSLWPTSTRQRWNEPFSSRPSTWQAYDFYLRGSESLRTYLSSYDGADLRTARKLLEQSLSVDPSYARAYVDLSYTYFTAWLNRVDADFLNPELWIEPTSWHEKPWSWTPIYPRLAPSSAWCFLFRRRHDDAIAEFERARAMNPNFDDWRFANFLIYAGDAARALEVSQALVRLDPFYLPLAAGFLGLANYMLKRHDTAIAGLSEAAGRSPRHRPVRQWLAAAYGQAGQTRGSPRGSSRRFWISSRSIRSKAWRSSSRPLGAQKTPSIYSTACVRPACRRIDSVACHPTLRAPVLRTAR